MHLLSKFSFISVFHFPLHTAPLHPEPWTRPSTGHLHKGLATVHKHPVRKQTHLLPPNPPLLFFPSLDKWVFVCSLLGTQVDTAHFYEWTGDEWKQNPGNV